MEDVVEALGYLTLGTRFRRIGERLQAGTQTIIDAMGADVPAAQFPLLAAIDRLGPLGVGELSRALGVSQPGVTRAVAQLTERGYLEIRLSEADKRLRQVALSQAGADLVAYAKAQVWWRVEEAVAALCAGLDGPLLSQLAAIEAGLDLMPLEARTTIAQGKTHVPHA